AGNVGAVVGRRGRRGAGIDTRGRGRQILDLVQIGVGPEAGGPLPTVLDLLPMAGHPLAVGRHGAPEAAHPDGILAVLVPLPVAWKPLNVVALGLLVGRQLINGRGRLAWHNGRWRGLARGRLGERFVNRPSCQDFYAIVLRGSLLVLSL